MSYIILFMLNIYRGTIKASYKLEQIASALHFNSQAVHGLVEFQFRKSVSLPIAVCRCGFSCRFILEALLSVFLLSNPVVSREEGDVEVLWRGHVRIHVP